MFCLSDNAQISEEMQWYEKMFRTKVVWYREGHGELLSTWPCDVVKQPVKATLKFLYEYLHFLLHIFVADTQTSSKHYKLLSSMSPAMKIWTLKFNVPSALALHDVHHRDI